MLKGAIVTKLFLPAMVPVRTTIGLFFLTISGALKPKENRKTIFDLVGDEK